MAHVDNTAQSLRLRIEGRVTQESSRNAGHFVCFDVKADDAVPPMGESLAEESHITSDQRGAAKLVPQGDDCVVVNALALDLTSDLADPYPPTSEERSLILGNVFIEQDHSAARS